MRRMAASLRKARAFRLRFSQSLARRRRRLSQAMVRFDDPALGQHLEPLGAIRAFDDLQIDVQQHPRQRLLKHRPLVAAVRVEFEQGGEQLKQAGHQQHPTVVIACWS